MCGLYGWNITRTTPALTVANAVLAQAMAGRGTDSWGILSDGKVRRGLESVTYAPETLKLPAHTNVAVHTRYGTTGKINVKNAHPFTIGAVIGMHNGIVYNHASLNLEYDRRMAVDSMHIFAHIAEERDLAEIEAYGAIVYTYADDPGTLFLGRFNGGELSVAHVSDKQGPIGIMWASTRHALKGACKLAGLKAKYYDIQQGRLYRVSDGRIYDIKVPLPISAKPKSYAKPYSNVYGTTWKQTPLDASYDRLYDDDGSDYYSDKCSTCYELPGEDCACDGCVCPACQAFWYHDWVQHYPDADNDDEPEDIRAQSTT